MSCQAYVMSKGSLNQCYVIIETYWTNSKQGNLNEITGLGIT